MLNSSLQTSLVAVFSSTCSWAACAYGTWHTLASCSTPPPAVPVGTLSPTPSRSGPIFSLPVTGWLRPPTYLPYWCETVIGKVQDLKNIGELIIEWLYIIHHQMAEEIVRSFMVFFDLCCYRQIQLSLFY